MNWSRLALAGALLACWPLLAAGQVLVELRIPSSKALAYESVNAVVTLRNNSGRTLLLDPKPEFAKLRFEIMLGDSKWIKPLSSNALLSGEELTPGETRSLEFNLSRLYAVNAIGLYKVRAVVEYGETICRSAPVYLEITKGVELSRLTAGVPDDPRALRLYVLEFIQKDREGEYLYLRIEDEKAGELYGVFNLGRIVRVRKPDLQVDESGNAHVLFQEPGMGFIHVVFTPYGTALKKESYPGGRRNVEMTRLSNGRITVSGAAGRESSKPVEGTTLPNEGPVTEFKKRVGGLFGGSKD
jgi:hypothetical protein